MILSPRCFRLAAPLVLAAALAVVGPAAAYAQFSGGAAVDADLPSSVDGGRPEPLEAHWGCAVGGRGGDRGDLLPGWIALAMGASAIARRRRRPRDRDRAGSGGPASPPI